MASLNGSHVVLSAPLLKMVGDSAIKNFLGCLKKRNPERRMKNIESLRKVVRGERTREMIEKRSDKEVDKER